jgi:WD40 repeat protein
MTFQFNAHSGAINRIRQLPNGLVATVSDDEKAKIWNVSSMCTSWTLIQSYTGHTSNVNDIEYINSTIMATCSNDKYIKIWSIITGTTLKSINTGSSLISLKLLPNRVHLACGLATPNSINIYNINTGCLFTTLNQHNGNVNDLILINNYVMASASSDKSVRIWNLTKVAQESLLNDHGQEVFSLKVISKTVLASGS